MREAPEQVDLQVNLVAEGRSRGAEPRHRGAGPPGDRGARARRAARGSRWWRSRPARRCSPRWWPRCTARPRPSATGSPARCARRSAPCDGHRGRRLDARTRPRRSSSSRSTARRPRCTASRRPTSSRRSPPRATARRSARFHVERGAAQVPVVLQLAPAQRARLDSSCSLTVPGARGPVPLSELVARRGDARGRRDPAQEPEAGGLRHRRPGRRDREPALRAPRARARSSTGSAATGGEAVARLRPRAPGRHRAPALKWDGEWHITLEVFRDLGLAFAAVIVLIYVLMVGWFQSFTMPLVILVPIPLSLVGILPGARRSAGPSSPRRA